MQDQVMLSKFAELISDDSSWTRQSANCHGNLKSVFGLITHLDSFLDGTFTVKATDDIEM